MNVAKGIITSWTCDPSKNGLLTSPYLNDDILGPSNHQLTQVTWSGGVAQWGHTNVWAAGKLIATYSPDPTGKTAGILNFELEDWLGTRRVQTDYAGVVEQTCKSLPYGNGLYCGNSLEFPTENHFTDKERDSESGNDYFGARYYSSDAGRFLSPDPSQLYYANPANPQTLNLYSYVANNPFAFVDPTGQWLQVSCYTSRDTYSTSTDKAGNTTVTVTAGKQHCRVWENGQGQPNNLQLPKPRLQQLNKIPYIGQSSDCTARQQFAAKLGNTLQRTSDEFGDVAFVGFVTTAVSSVGEVPSGGLDTGATITAASVTSFSEDVSLATGVAASTLKSYARGNSRALTNFDVSRLSGLAATLAASKFPFLRPFAKTIGYAAEKAASLKLETPGVCSDSTF